ncbi:M42 family metallopeptidase [Parvibacter caecicola]|uniref:Endoglucanase n=1 Tax=Parvibacter caecicola TaxID=747645 RepID=A0A7W5GNM2_9ACTN|nr:M42 family metallopeptidase [Parvibacter caecicola]MBB3170475.1 endoglucanase [Parvibacter caecicola]MCR2041562.1 M42 family metallopeptidase [Parvibacter caecicola]RNL12133.1 peptidase M42 [Parvibacter caecicola]
MNKEEIAFLQGLLETPSPTGCEEPVAQLARERLAGTADEIATDTMGTVTARLEGRGAGPALMLAAHMDEVGLMVTYISDEGFLSVAMVGGVDAAVLPGMRVDVHTEGGVLRGVVGRKPIHLISPDERKNVTPMDKLVIDLGLPADQVKERVRIGDEITYGVGFELFGEGMAVSRAFDDKCGVYVAARVLENLAEAGRAEGAFIAAATVQEEIGTRGAITCAHAVNPDVALAFDVTHATDYPGIEKSKYGSITCGEGPVIARGPNINPVVFRRLVAAAEAEGIPYQLEAEPSVTGTDARAIQVTRGGIPTGLISVPLRYMHTPTEVVCLEDLDNTVKLITRFALDLHGDLSFVPGMGDGTGEKVSAGEQIEDSERAAAESEAARMDDVMESLDREVRAIEDFISSEE